MNVTANDIQTALKTMATVCEAIKEAGSIPSGVLYATLMDRMCQSAYDSMIREILRTGLVRQDNHLLIWVG